MSERKAYLFQVIALGVAFKVVVTVRLLNYAVYCVLLIKMGTIAETVNDMFRETLKKTFRRCKE